MPGQLLFLHLLQKVGQIRHIEKAIRINTDEKYKNSRKNRPLLL
jgi:hypothetical protein